MNLEGILYISGKQGLFKIVSTSKNKIIIESLHDKKRTAISSNQQANMLEEIGIYTYTETVSLSTIFEKIAIRENANKTISHKSKDDEISSYFRQILNEYDVNPYVVEMVDLVNLRIESVFGKETEKQKDLSLFFKR